MPRPKKEVTKQATKQPTKSASAALTSSAVSAVANKAAPKKRGRPPKAKSTTELKTPTVNAVTAKPAATKVEEKAAITFELGYNKKDNLLFIKNIAFDSKDEFNNYMNAYVPVIIVTDKNAEVKILHVADAKVRVIDNSISSDLKFKTIIADEAKNKASDSVNLKAEHLSELLDTTLITRKVANLAITSVEESEEHGQDSYGEEGSEVDNHEGDEVVKDEDGFKDSEKGNDVEDDIEIPFEVGDGEKGPVGSQKAVSRLEARNAREGEGELDDDVDVTGDDQDADTDDVNLFSDLLSGLEEDSDSFEDEEEDEEELEEELEEDTDDDWSLDDDDEE